MFSFPSFFCTAEATGSTGDLDFEWSVSAAGDLDSLSTTQPDDGEDEAYDDEEGEEDDGEDSEEEVIFEKADATLDGEDGEKWVHFGSPDEAKEGRDVSRYGPEDVYRFVLAGAAPIRRAPTLQQHLGVTEDGAASEAVHSEQPRKTVTTPRESNYSATAMLYDMDGFPMLPHDDSDLCTFMESRSLRPREIRPQLSSAGARSSVAKRGATSATACMTPAPKLDRPTSPHPSACSSSPEPARSTKRHIRWWGHGRVRTCAAIFMAWMGSTLSVLTRHSTRFVTLDEPLAVASTSYEPVSHLGLFRINLCFNETHTVNSGAESGGCQVLALRSNDVSDNLYEVARLFGSLGMILGTFLTLFLTTSVAWETINLRPIGFGLLLTYFFQSFTMLLFDSRLCETNGCRVGAGCLMSIGSACFWLGSCLATAAMEAYKIRATRQRQRRARRLFKRAAREARKKSRQKLDRHNRKESIDTFKTSSTSSLGAVSAATPEELGSVVEIPSIERSNFGNNEEGQYEV